MHVFRYLYIYFFKNLWEQKTLELLREFVLEPKTPFDDYKKFLIDALAFEEALVAFMIMLKIILNWCFVVLSSLVPLRPSYLEHSLLTSTMGHIYKALISLYFRFICLLSLCHTYSADIL
ncbi:hypothetical protein BD560DRAFT_474619 [Blakeslea trispora]|nr:hypothetical protein BD560DRAFT_474619 [Blakeslea trispora]